LVGANDSLLENVAGGKRRGRFQGHWTDIYDPAEATGVQTGGTLIGIVDGSPTNKSNRWVGKNIISDGSNGTPRTGPETDVRNLAVHFYIGLGGLDT